MDKKKALGSVDVFFGMVVAILFADTIASNASMGPAIIVWWIILGLLFFVPNGLITAELTAAYPDQGSIYSWVLRAFGPVWAARLSWLYFINCALWMPSGFIWFSGCLCDAFFPGTSYFVQIVISIAITWVCVGIACLPLSDSKLVINIGGISKILIFLLVIVSGFVAAAKGLPMANDMSWDALKPTFDGSLMYLPVVIYCCCGMEVIATNSHEMRDPKKDLPRAVLLVVAITMIGNILASWSLLRVVPLDDIDLVTGIATMASTVFDSPFFFNLIVITLLISVAVQMVVWALGGARGGAEAGKGGELPAVFGLETKGSGMPYGGLVISGIISTVILIVYGFMAESASDLFWTLFAFSSVLFFMPYAIMFPAYIKLKNTDHETERPVVAPAGKFFSVICEIIIFVVIVLFIHVPGEPFDASYSMPIIIGLIITLVFGEWLVQHQLKKGAAEGSAE